MNVNKKINQIEKKVSQQIDEMTLKNIDELNDKIYEYFTPYAEEMQQIVMEVYSHPYMTIDQFEEYSKEMVLLCEVFHEDNRDEVMLKLSEDVLASNSNILHESIDEMMIELGKVGISYNRAILEYKKMMNSAISRTQRFFNMNYHEVCGELKAICSFCLDSMLDYSHSRLIEDDIEIEIEPFAFEEVTNNRLIRTDSVYDIIELAVDNGFTKERQHGSHCIYKHSNGQILVVPIHGKTINVGLAFGIQKQIYNKIAY